MEFCVDTQSAPVPACPRRERRKQAADSTAAKEEEAHANQLGTQRVVLNNMPQHLTTNARPVRTFATCAPIQSHQVCWAPGSAESSPRERITSGMTCSNTFHMSLIDPNTGGKCRIWIIDLYCQEKVHAASLLSSPAPLPPLHHDPCCPESHGS